MTEELIRTVVMAIAAVLGAVAGRVFAVEAQNRPTAIFAATYIGAGAGLVSSVPIASILTLIARMRNSNAEFFSVLDALDVTGSAIVSGVASGAAGGLLLGIIVAAMKRA